jgi:sulfatase modifying factor 1
MANYVCDMVYTPKFTNPDISGVTFGGFWAAKYVCSQPNATPDDDNPDVADDADPGTVPAISQPGVASWRYISYWRARKAAANLGVGWHLLTAFELASLAFWAQLNGTMPHGNNNNSAECNDCEFTSEKALPDRAALARDPTYYASLPGTGPNAFSHNHRADGVHDLNGNMWEWVLGLHMRTADEGADAGKPLVLASLEVSQTRAPYGKSTGVGSGSLTDSNKAWTADEFNGCILMDAGGERFSITDTTATQLTLSTPGSLGNSTPASGPYEILKAVDVNITTGMTSGHSILTLRDSDADLKAFAIPATADETGSTTYGQDGYWFNTADPGDAPNNIRSALRGGYWSYGVRAGVFAVTLGHVPSNAYCYIGFRVGKSL